MGRLPEAFGPDVEVEEVDLDTADLRYRGRKLNESRAEEVAADILSHQVGSSAGAKEMSPSLTSGE